MDMFEAERTNMLSFGITLEVSRRLVPNIFREGLDWKHWCNGLSEDEISRVRTNRNSLEYCVRVTSEKLVARGYQYDNLWVIYDRLMTLLARLNGSLSADYVPDIPEGW